MKKSRTVINEIALAIFFILVAYGTSDYLYDLVVGNDANIMVSFKPLMFYFLIVGMCLSLLIVLMSILILYIFIVTSIREKYDDDTTA